MDQASAGRLAGWAPGERDGPKRAEPMRFIPVTVVDEIVSAPPAAPSNALTIAPVKLPRPAIPRRAARKEAKRRGVIEIALPDGARINVDGEVDEAALRAVLSAMKDRR